MPELLLLDTSAALPLLLVDHEQHDVAFARVRGHRIGLAGHAAFELYSVVTRLRSPRRLRPHIAATAISQTFPDTRHPSAGAQAELAATLAARGIVGGAVYDALVALAAREHDATLLAADRRAADTYRAVGARFELI